MMLKNSYSIILAEKELYLLKEEKLLEKLLETLELIIFIKLLILQYQCDIVVLGGPQYVAALDLIVPIIPDQCPIRLIHTHRCQNCRLPPASARGTALAVSRSRISQQVYLFQIQFYCSSRTSHSSINVLFSDFNL